MNSTFITDDQIWRHEGEVTATTELPERRTELKWPARVQRRSEVFKYFIMTRGTTISGPPHKRLKRRKVLTDGHYSIETEVVPIERPLAVYELYKYFSNVDIHDHLRQGSLMLETHWRTKIWWHRLFSSILGMIFTDTYLAHQWDLANGWDADTYDKEPLTNYMRRLSYQLIHFNDPTPIITRSATIAEEVGPKVSGIHLIIQFSFCMKYV
jgi:hypothetical protein